MSTSINDRKRLYTLLRVGNSDLQQNLYGWDDEQYRELLQRCGAKEKNGKVSATTMTHAELNNAYTELKRLGFKPKQKNGADWRKPRIAKLNAMWISLADLGVVNNRSEDAMRTWCTHNVQGLNKLQWATSDQLNKAIEMMKAMLAQRLEK